MKTRILNTLILGATLALPMAFNIGCEVSHTESDKPGWFGGSKHEEKTTIKNPDGSTAVESEKTTVKP